MEIQYKHTYIFHFIGITNGNLLLENIWKVFRQVWVFSQFKTKFVVNISESIFDCDHLGMTANRVKIDSFVRKLNCVFWRRRIFP